MRRLILSLVVAAACSSNTVETKPSGGSESSEPTKSTPAGSGTSTTTGEPAAKVSATGVTIDSGPRPAGVDARVKAEVDNRADGITGTALAVAGARATLQTPKDWKTTKGETTLVAPADQKATLAVASYGTEGVEIKLTKVLTDAGLTNCQWAGPENVAVGKDKLPGQATDGVCTKDGAQQKTAWVAAEGLLTVVAWAPGGADADLFASLRSIVRAAGKDLIGSCCATLAQNAKAAPPQQKPAYDMAIGTCNNVKVNPAARAALLQALAALRAAGGQVPAGC